jgi:hypothetical protein
LLSFPKGIQKAFITGIAPLSLTGIGSGFNVATYLSSDEDVAGLCGLTRVDIEAALKEIYGSDLEAYRKHLSDMTTYLNGYHFCNEKTVETVYNTETCLAYLQVRTDISPDYFQVSLLSSVADGHGHGKRPRASDPLNSEVSEKILRRFAAQ